MCALPVFTTGRSCHGMFASCVEVMVLLSGHLMSMGKWVAVIMEGKASGWMNWLVVPVSAIASE